MEDGLSVCHVVNTIRDNSMPGDLATTQKTLDKIDRVGVLVWFDAEPFRDDDMVELYCLDIPDGKYHINRTDYREARDVLSDYDIIHTHNPHSGFYAKLIAQRLGKPVVHTDHNNHDGFTRKGRIANGLTSVFADRIAPVSESVRKSYAWWEELIIDDDKVKVINNGVDPDRLDAAQSTEWSIHDAVDIDSEAVIVGSAGALVEQKAHDVLINAVDRANREGQQPIELVISGDGELGEQLEAQIASADYSDRLHLLGFLEEREQVYKMMHEIDIYAMPSRWEGFCVAALEGLALGNPCLFSNIPEFTEPFDRVARFHNVDDSEDLAANLVTLADNERLRQELGDSAKQLILEEYTLEQTTQKYKKIYDEVFD